MRLSTDALETRLEHFLISFRNMSQATIRLPHVVLMRSKFPILLNMCVLRMFRVESHSRMFFVKTNLQIGFQDTTIAIYRNLSAIFVSACDACLICNDVLVELLCLVMMLTFFVYFLHFHEAK